MKKNYLLIVLAVLGFSTVNAQVSMRNTVKKFKAGSVMNSNPAARINPHNSSSLPSSVIWSDQFNDTSKWVFDHLVGTSTWEMGLLTPSLSLPPLASGTAGDGIAIFDSQNQCDSVNGQIANLTTKNPINCTGHPLVELTFAQFYGRYHDSSFVFISNDGNTWTKFNVNQNYTPNQLSPVNPDMVSINISSVAGNQDSVYVRFQYYSDTTMYTTGGPAGCNYSWQIDDASIADINSIDAALAPAFAGEYSVIPIIQPEAFLLRGKVINHGTAQLSGARIAFEVIPNSLGTPVLYDTSVASSTINPGDTSVYLSPINSFFTAPAFDVYTVNQTVVVPGDSNTANDHASSQILVDDSTYARNFTTGGTQSFGFPTGSGYIGTLFHIYHSSDLTSATFNLLNPIAGDSVRVVVFNAPLGVPNTTVRGATDYHVLDPGDIFPMTMQFQNGIAVTPGDYMVAIQQVRDSGFLSIMVSDDIYTFHKTFYKPKTATSWTAFETIPAQVALQLEVNNPSGTLLGVKEAADKTSLFSIYPNPTSNSIYVNSNGVISKNVKVNVINNLGQVVKTVKYDSLQNGRIDLGKFPAGVYTINIRTDKGEENKIVILN